MITVIIILACAILGVVIGIKGCESVPASIVLGLTGCIVGLAITVSISVAMSYTFKVEYYIEEEKPIYAIQDNNNISGSFFLGSGNVDGDMKYVYLVKDEFGMQMKSIECENVIINESDKPSIVIYASNFKNNFLKNNFASVNEKTVINIPKGSIKYNFNIDLK